MTHLQNTVIQHNRSGRPPLTLGQFTDPIDEEFQAQSTETAWFLPDTDTSAPDEPEEPVPSHELIPSALSALTGVQTAIQFLIHQSSTTFRNIGDLDRINRVLNRYLMNARNEQGVQVTQNVQSQPQLRSPQTPQATNSPQSTTSAQYAQNVQTTKRVPNQQQHPPPRSPQADQSSRLAMNTKRRLPGFTQSLNPEQPTYAILYSG